MFGDNIILYRENPNDSTKKTLELINKFSKVAKINIQKSAAFPYTNNKTSEKERNKTIAFTIASKTVKY